MRTITIDSVNYEIGLYDGNICLEAPDHSVILTGGHEKLRDKATWKYSYTIRDEYYCSDDNVEEYISRNLENYILNHFSEGVVYAE